MRKKVEKFRGVIAVVLTAGLLFSGWAVAGGAFPDLGAGDLQPAASPYVWEDGALPDTGPTIEIERVNPYYHEWYDQTYIELVWVNPYYYEWYDQLYVELEWVNPDYHERYNQPNVEFVWENPYYSGLYQYGLEYGYVVEESPQAEPLEYGYPVDTLPWVEPVMMPNLYVMPQQERFTIMQAFELNGYTLDSWSLSNVQMDVQPPGSEYNVALITVDPEHIRAAWEILSQLEVQRVYIPRPAPTLPPPPGWDPQPFLPPELSDTSVWVGFQFSRLDGSWHSLVGVEMFGPVHILGHGPLEFAPGSCPQPFIDLYSRLT